MDTVVMQSSTASPLQNSSISTGPLESLVADTAPCILEPMEFFVSWQGVLTIAYTGFPDPLLELKSKIVDRYPGLVQEFPGSKWPKTSIACLYDNRRLSMEDLEKLRRICSEEDFVVPGGPVNMEDLSVVLYANCCLDQTFMSTDITLKRPKHHKIPNPVELASVRAVIDEFRKENLDNYYFHASKDGNRSAHYRGFKPGVTLVHRLACAPRALARFRERVEEELPNMYDWFPESSLHITIRAIL